MKKRYILPFAVIAVASLVGCSSNNEELNSNPPTKETPINESITKNTQEQTVFEIGQTVEIHSTVGSYEVTPENTTFVDAYQEHASRRGSFVKAEVEMKNTSDKPIRIHTISNSDGRVMAITKDRVARPDVVEIAEQVEEINPNETVNLTMYFDVVEDSEYHLVFGNDLTSNETHWRFD